jgi:HK97 family phage prohead protease
MSENVMFNAEFRLAEDSDGRTIAGIAVPYDQISFNAPNAGGERFAQGSLTKTANDLMASTRKKLKIFKSHEHRTAIGYATLLQADHPDGLWMEARIADTAEGNAALAEIKEGVLDSFSIGFRTIKDSYVDGVRVINEAALVEVSLVPLPAYEGAELVSVRNAFEPITIGKMPNVPGWMRKI